jgi:hypothetical protein
MEGGVGGFLEWRLEMGLEVIAQAAIDGRLTGVGRSMDDSIQQYKLSKLFLIVAFSIRHLFAGEHQA